MIRLVVDNTMRGERLGLMGDNLRHAFELPPRDPEIALLTQIASSLLSGFTEEGCDMFLDRLAAWEAENRVKGILD